MWQQQHHGAASWHSVAAYKQHGCAVNSGSASAHQWQHQQQHGISYQAASKRNLDARISVWRNISSENSQCIISNISGEKAAIRIGSKRKKKKKYRLYQWRRVALAKKARISMWRIAAAAAAKASASVAKRRNDARKRGVTAAIIKIGSSGYLC